MVSTVMTEQIATRERPARPETLPELGARIGMPIQVRRWWGSVRRTDELVHSVCGHGRIWRTGPNSYWCGRCATSVVWADLKVERRPHEWLCPAGYSYNRIRRPEVQNGVVIVWAGQCRHRDHRRSTFRPHLHRQRLEVVDVMDQALLLRVSVNKNYSHLLIGMDDGHPFVTPVVRRLTTVQDAFDWLVPNMVRNAFALGLDVKRQGDWFFIPTDKEPLVHKHGSDMRWARPTLKTNVLYRGPFLAYGAQTRHRGGLVVYQTVSGSPYVIPFVKGNVKAPDHPTLHLSRWHIGVRTRSTPAGSSNGPGVD